jgi:assimilatory nitrate reductase catalytic subunit
VGCGLEIKTDIRADGKQKIVGVHGDAQHPANFGRLCTKGSTLHLSAQDSIYDQVRGRHPEQCQLRDGVRQPVSWAEAAETVAQRLAQIIKTHGPNSVGFYLSGQMLTEDYYVFNKLAKGLVGTNNVDSNSRLCMSSAVAGYKQTLGSDAPPCCYEDINAAQTIFITGSNTAFAHPILFRRIEQAREKNPGQKLIVVDVRETDTSRSADLFLKIQPGTDVVLHHGLLHVMLSNGWTDTSYIESHTEGFEALSGCVADYPPSLVCQICGIAETDLYEAARLFACAGPTLSLYCQGLNQSSAGTDKNTSLINLHLATGQIGRVGAGPFSLTGQPNAMGGREVGAMANLLSAHRDLKSAEDRAEVAALWGLPSVPDQPGLTAVPMFEALRQGELKAIWIVCTNPAQSLPNQTLVHEALRQAELVIVQDAYANTATVAYADIFLPATTWGEKDGTVTNSERRISRVRAAVPPYADCRHDWEIGVDIARRMAALLVEDIGAADRLFPYTSPEDVWNEHRATTAGRDLDITGLSYDILEDVGPQQWPMRTGMLVGQQRLYEDGVFQTPSGRARFAAPVYRPTAEERDQRFPFAVTTGRLRDQWHGMSRTGNLGRLFSHAPHPCVQINPADARRLDLENDELVYVTSRRGCQMLPVALSEDISCSQAFVAMHWGGEFVAGRAGKAPGYGVNTLTIDTIDPISKQPEFKHAAVALRKANAPWHLSACGRFAPEDAIRIQNTLRHKFNDGCYGSAVIFGRESEPSATSEDGDAWLGVEFRLASLEPVNTSLIEALRQLFGLNDVGVVNYRDPRSGTARFIGLSRESERYQVRAFLLTGGAQAVVSRHWLRGLLENATDVTQMSRQLATPDKQAPLMGLSLKRGKVVCNCFNTSSIRIEEILATLTDQTPEGLVQSLKTRLGCGTNCGSCVPELKQMAGEHLSDVARQP